MPGLSVEFCHAGACKVALAPGFEGSLRFVKFRPPKLTGESFPHIRLDRTLDFLIGDHLS